MKEVKTDKFKGEKINPKKEKYSELEKVNTIQQFKNWATKWL